MPLRLALLLGDAVDLLVGAQEGVQEVALAEQGLARQRRRFRSRLLAAHAVDDGEEAEVRAADERVLVALARAAVGAGGCDEARSLERSRPLGFRARAGQAVTSAEALHRELHLAVGQGDLRREGVDRDLAAGLDQPALHLDGVGVGDPADEGAVLGGLDPELALVDLAVGARPGPRSRARWRWCGPARGRRGCPRGSVASPPVHCTLSRSSAAGLTSGADEALGHALGEVGEGLRHRAPDAHRHLGGIGAPRRRPPPRSPP